MRTRMSLDHLTARTRGKQPRGPEGPRQAAGPEGHGSEAPASTSEGSDQAASNPAAATRQGAQARRAPAGTIITPSADFGPNEWLVDELYQRYQADPSSVDRAWWNFFADYRPEPTDGGARGQQPDQRAAPGASRRGPPCREPR